jgi:hypothetical protein
MALAHPAAAPATRVVFLDANGGNGARDVLPVLRVVDPYVQVCSDLAALPPAGDGTVVVASYESLDERARAELATRCAVPRAAGRLLLLASVQRRDELATMFGEHGFMNVVGRNLEVNADELLVTLQKMRTHDIFGLEKYFLWGSCHENHVLSDTEGIRSCLDAAERFAGRLGIPRRFAVCFVSVTDELLTNALYNAPVDRDTGQARFDGVPRTQPVHLDAGERLEVAFASDGRRVGVAVSDPFGSLSAGRVLSYLAKCFRAAEDQVDSKPGGAGLGLFQTFESVSHFAINLAPSRRTEAIGLLDVRGGYREFAARAKSFNVFVC